MKQAPTASEGLLDALVPVAFATMAVLSRIGAENDLSLTLMRVCGILDDRRPRMAELADYLGLEKSTMTGLVARAESRGLVGRAPNADDGRAVDVFLTDDGRKLVDRLQLQFRQAMAPMTDKLGGAEQKALGDLLRRMGGG